MTPLPPSLSASSYGAFQARCHAEINAKARLPPNLPFRQQQRLLRVHLRHFLSTVERNAEVNDGSATEDGVAWMTQIKRTVRSREAAAKCKTPAKTNSSRRQQKRFRVQPEMPTRHDEDGQRKKIHTAMPHTENNLLAKSKELELHSTSTFIPLLPDMLHVWSPTQDTRDADRSPSPVSYEPVTQHPTQSKGGEIEAIKSDQEDLFPYELAIELLAARELAISSSHSMTSRIAIGAELYVLQKGQTSQQNALLRIGIDPASEDPIVRHDPQVVISEWSIGVVVKMCQDGDEAHRSAGTTLGKLEVPLILLETPLAQEYAMCRWFPLEKASPGVPTRGDIRVRTSFSMLQQSLSSENGGPRMVPYKPKVEENSDAKQTKVSTSQLQKRKKKSLSASTTGNKQSTSSAKSDSGSILSRRTSGSVQARQHPPSTKPTPYATRSQTITSPRRPPRMEAFSPPSSPSSFSSDNDDVQQKMLSSPRLRRSSISTRLSKHQDEDPSEQQPPPIGSPSSSKPTQPFLKRKPYKVVFRKLDWSSVSSRTDSSWSHNTPTGDAASQNHTGAKAVAPRSPRSARSARVETTTAAPAANASTVAKTKKSGVSSLDDGEARRKRSEDAVVLHPAIKDRLQTVSRTIYDCCQVTPQTKSLAQLKYQAERRRCLLAFSQSQFPAASTGSEHGTPGNNAIEIVPNITLSALWKELVADATGELYATKLENLLAKGSFAPLNAKEARDVERRVVEVDLADAIDVHASVSQRFLRDERARGLGVWIRLHEIEKLLGVFAEMITQRVVAVLDLDSWARIERSVD
ncbi:hypothetical protein FI667_g17233, partial [Globisporangium splendens]